jgi:hypothetical protein
MGESNMNDDLNDDGESLSDLQVATSYYRSILPGAFCYYNKQDLAEEEAQRRQQHRLSCFFDQRLVWETLCMHHRLRADFH